MHTFKDARDRTWHVAVTVAAAKRCRDLAGTDLLGLVADKLRPLGELLADPVRLVDVLYVLCADQAKAAGVTDEQFGEAMHGDALDHAANAFVEALVDFFPRPDVREALRRAASKAREVEGKMATAALAEIDEIDPQEVAIRLLAKLRSEARTSGGTSGSAPASSA